MDVLFVGGPWHGQIKAGPVPRRDEIEGPDFSRYILWSIHPATAGILAEPCEQQDCYVIAGLEPRELLKRVEEVLIQLRHYCDGDAAVAEGAPPSGNYQSFLRNGHSTRRPVR